MSRLYVCTNMISLFFLPHSTDKWKFSSYCGPGTVKGLWGDNWTAYLPYANPNSLLSTGCWRHALWDYFQLGILNVAYIGLPSHVQPSPFSPCPCLSPSRLRGLVRLPETEHHSVRMRLPKAPPRQEGPGHWLYDNNYCLLSMSFGGLFEQLTESCFFCAESISVNKLFRSRFFCYPRDWVESVEAQGMKGNDYLLNALLFGGVESVDLWLQWNSARGVNDMLYQCLFSFYL